MIYRRPVVLAGKGRQESGGTYGFNFASPPQGAAARFRDADVSTAMPLAHIRRLPEPPPPCGTPAGASSSKGRMRMGEAVMAWAHQRSEVFFSPMWKKSFALADWKSASALLIRVSASVRRVCASISSVTVPTLLR